MAVNKKKIKKFIEQYEVLRRAHNAYLVLRYKEISDVVIHCFGNDTSSMSMRFRHNLRGTLSDTYYIDKLDKADAGRGFFGNVYWTLMELYFAEEINLKPFIYWPADLMGYKMQSNACSDNVFDEFFIQSIPITYDDIIHKSKFYTFRAFNDSMIFRKLFIPNESLVYNITEETVSKLAILYEKYFRLNKHTKDRIESDINRVFLEKWKILSVHIRGTDFKQNYNNHPKFVSFSSYLHKTKMEYSNGKYNKVFLATDDVDAYYLFKKEFGESLVCFEECKRASGNVGIHTMNKNKCYDLYYEVLRDAYALAKGNALICGVSNVSIAARYIKISFEEVFDKVIILDRGINTNKNSWNF